MQFIFRIRRTITAWTFSLAISVGILFNAVKAQQLEIKFNLLELPSSRAGQTDFAKPVFASVEQQPLGKSLVELARTYQVALWLDRRVDRSRLITYSGTAKDDADQSALARLRAIAQHGGAEAGLVENVLYVGPPNQVAAVQRAAVRLHDELSRVDRDAKLQSLVWEDITTPSDVLEQIKTQWNIQIAAELPHDLMHGGELPRCTLATQLTLLCAGFSLQARCDSLQELSTEPLDVQSSWQANYAKRELQMNQLASAKRDYPGGNASIQGTIATVVGPTNFHLRLFAPPRAAPRRVQEVKFSIPEINAPLAKILGDLSKQLGMTLEWSEQVTDAEKQSLLRLHVPQPQTLTEVLKIISRDSGVTVSHQEQTISVTPQNME